MAGSSKILTVSYGTFSCTLEGFDDPFGTMRDIAEYFRDLAADDRYFGAEPPTPDADMLHRIAENEAKRRVEARVGTDSILLRQVEEEASAPMAPEPPIADQDDPSENMFADIGDADDEAARTDDPEVLLDTPLEGEPGNSVAAKLSRIRAVVTRGIVPAPAAQFSGPIHSAFSDTHEPAEDEPASFEEADLEAAADAEAVDELMALDGVDEPPSSDAESEADMWSAPSDALDATTDAEDAVSEEEAEEDIAAHDGESDEIAAEITETEPVSEPWGSPETSEDPEPALAEDTDEGEDDHQDVSAVEDLAPAFDEVPDLAEAVEAVEPVGSDADLPDVIDLDEAEQPIPDPDEAKSGLAARIIRLKRAAMGEAEQPKPVEDEPLSAHEIADMSTDPGGALADDEPEFEDDADPVEATAPAAALEEVNIFDEVEDDDEDDPATADFDLDDPFGDNAKDDLEEALNDVEIAVDPDVAEPQDEDDEAAETDEPAAPEDGLAALIGQAVQEANSPAAEHETAPKAAPAAAAAASAPENGRWDDLSEDRRSTLVEPEESEQAFDRILEQTNNRLDDSEGNRRRSAIAHLKAAVAATKADRLMKRRVQPEAELEEEQSRYRDDLAKVVRPRPAEDAATANASSDDTGSQAEDDDLPLEDPAMDQFELPPEPKSQRRKRVETRPLILVSEQQIIENAKAAEDNDEDEGEDVAMVEGDAEHGFADFARQMGATELPDLLEAAAAYSAFVEEKPEFSRPQIMRRVVNFDQSKEITREAGLRSFGQLLRQGKIQKLKRGQFTISEDSRFNPRSRIAGE